MESSKSKEKLRLDELLVEKALCENKSKAKALILAGTVLVNGQKVTKAGQKYLVESKIELLKQGHDFVSRGGLKIEHAINHFKVDIKDKVCMDIGVSTGGFTDCLLKREAKHVVAVDVGYGQIAYKLRTDPRISLFERTNIRYFDINEVDNNFSKIKLFVIDVSFISLKLIFPLFKDLTTEKEFEALCLVKPQFELSKEEVAKGGIVKDEALRQKALNQCIAAAESEQLICMGSTLSPIQGAKGNYEYLIHLKYKI